MTTCVKSGVASASSWIAAEASSTSRQMRLCLSSSGTNHRKPKTGAPSARASGSASGLPARANWTTSPVNRAAKPSGVTVAGPARPGSMSCSSVSVARVTTASRCAGPSAPSTGTAASSTTQGVPIAGMPSAAASRAAASKPRRPAAWSRVSSEYGGGNSRRTSEASNGTRSSWHIAASASSTSSFASPTSRTFPPRLPRAAPRGEPGQSMPEHSTRTTIYVLPRALFRKGPGG